MAGGRILTLPAMSFSDALPDAPKPPIAHPVRVFLVANFLYLWVVHVWGLWLPPLAADHVALDSFDTLPFLTRGWLSLMNESFGTWYVGYRIVNLVLLYGCMIGVFFITKAVVKGPWWLGSLAAVLLMANPLKTESTLAITGVVELLPAFLAVFGILLAIWPFGPSKGAAEFGGAIFIALAMRNSHAYVLAPFVVVCLQLCSVGFRPVSVVFWALMGSAVVFLHDGVLKYPLTGGILSEFLIVYPIGLLPQTATALHESAVLSVGAAVLMVAAWLALWRATRHPAVLWCGIAAFVLGVAMPPIDLVSMAGGGTMLLPIALVAVGFAGVCHSVLQHPAWPRHVVFLTTVLCLVFFGLQVRAIRASSVETPAAAAVTSVRL